MDKLKNSWLDLKGAHKTALIIFALAIVWVSSGVLTLESEPAEASQHHGPTRVQVVALTAMDRQGELKVLGLTEAARTANMKAQIDAVVEARLVDKGAVVSEGTALVRLAMDDRHAKLTQAQALLKQQQIGYDAAKKLSADGYRSALKVAESKAGLEAARAGVARARLDVNNAVLKAPFSGVVDDILLDVGDKTGKEAVVVRMVDLSTLVVAAEVAETEMPRLALGKAASVRIARGPKMDGVLSYIARTSNPITRTFRVEVRIDNPDHTYAQGMTAQLRLPLETVKAHQLTPAVLTLSEDGQVGLKAVDENNTVVFYSARMVGDTPEGIWLADLPENLTVIVVGQEFVRAGQTVDPVAINLGNN